MSSVIPSKRDLSFPGNPEQARYELLKAIDRGGDAEQAAWTRDWGEAALAHFDNLNQDWGENGPSQHIVHAVEAAAADVANIHKELELDSPDLPKLRERLARLRRRISTLSEATEAWEE